MFHSSSVKFLCFTSLQIQIIYWQKKVPMILIPNSNIIHCTYSFPWVWLFFFLWLTESLITRPGSFWNTPYLTPPTSPPPFHFHFITKFFLNLTAGTAVAFHKARSDQHFSALPVPLMHQLHITSKCAVLCTCDTFDFNTTRVYTHSAQAK